MGNELSFSVVFDEKKVDLTIPINELKEISKLFEIVQNKILSNWKLSESDFQIISNFNGEQTQIFSKDSFYSNLNSFQFVVIGKYNITGIFDDRVEKISTFLVNIKELSEKLRSRFNNLNDIFTIYQIKNEIQGKEELKGLIGLENSFAVNIFNKYEVKCFLGIKEKNFVVFVHNYKDFELKVLKEFEIKKDINVYLRIQDYETLKWDNVKSMRFFKEKVSVKIVRNFKTSLFTDTMDELF